MMEALRTSAGSWIAKIFIGLLAISFAIWGIADVFRPSQDNVLATVGDQEISAVRFERNFDRQVRAFGERSGSNITAEQARAIGLDREVLNQMLNGAALDNQAALLDLKLSERYVVEQLAENPVFHDASGKFSADRFRQVLAQNGLGEAEAISSERDSMISGGILDAVAAAPAVPDTMTEIAWLHRNELRDARWFTIPADTVAVPEPTDAEMKTFYDSNQARFTVPDRRTAAIISVTPATLAASIEVPEADVRAEYDKRKDTLGVPETRRILQIPFPNVDEAAKARQAIAGGKSFEDVAKERGLKDTDMTLGDLTKAQVLDAAVADAAFALALNDVSQPVQGKLSTFLVKVTNIVPAKQQTFEEARAGLAGEIAKERARDEIIDLHGKIEDARAGGKTFEELAKEFNLPIRIVGPISRDGRDDKGVEVKDLPEGETLIAAIFESDTGVENDPVPTQDDGFVWFDVREVSPSSLRPFGDVKAEVIDGWKKQKRREGVLAAAQALVKRLEQGARLDDLAKEAGREVKSQSGVKRTESNENFDAGAVAALFAVPPTGFAAALEPDGAGAKVIQSMPVMQPPFDANGTEAKAIERVLGQRMTGDLTALYLQGLLKDYGVKLNEDLWRKLAGER